MKTATFLLLWTSTPKPQVTYKSYPKPTIAGCGMCQTPERILKSYKKSQKLSKKLSTRNGSFQKVSGTRYIMHIYGSSLAREVPETRMISQATPPKSARISLNLGRRCREEFPA